MIGETKGRGNGRGSLPALRFRGARRPPLRDPRHCGSRYGHARPKHLVGARPKDATKDQARQGRSSGCQDIVASAWFE
jgi:hypothetical protein